MRLKYANAEEDSEPTLEGTAGKAGWRDHGDVMRIWKAKLGFLETSFSPHGIQMHHWILAAERAVSQGLRSTGSEVSANRWIRNSLSEHFLPKEIIGIQSSV